MYISDCLLRTPQFAGSGISPEEWARVARFYEVSGGHDKAGDMWTKCGQYEAALRSYIKGGNSSLDKAITMVPFPPPPPPLPFLAALPRPASALRSLLADLSNGFYLGSSSYCLSRFFLPAACSPVADIG